MKSRKSYTINKINFPGLSSSKVHKVMSTGQYEELQGFGITNIFKNGDLLEAVLIKKNTTYINEYDFSTKAFERKQITLFKQVKFTIDFGMGLLYTNGPPSALYIVKVFLRNLASLKFELSSVEIQPYSIYKKLIKERISFNIIEMTIDNFAFMEGLIGKYRPAIKNKKAGLQLLQDYHQQVIKLVIEFDNFIVHFYRNDIFTIVGEEDEREDNLYHIKNLI